MKTAIITILVVLQVATCVAYIRKTTDLQWKEFECRRDSTQAMTQIMHGLNAMAEDERNYQKSIKKVHDSRPHVIMVHN